VLPKVTWQTIDLVAQLGRERCGATAEG